MSPIDDAPRRSRSNWPLGVVFLLLGLAGGTLIYAYWPEAALPPRPSQPLPKLATAPAPAAPAQPRQPAPALAAPKAAGPSFDVVRVGPQGLAVIAGRAAQGADVIVRDGSRVLGQTRADAQGQFLLLPDIPLQPGARELTLSARSADGIEVAGAESVFLIVPAAPNPAVGAEPAVAVLLPHDAGAPRVLDGRARSRKLGLETVDYDDSGNIRFAGSAKPDSSVRVYVDNRPVGDASAGAGGLWTIVPSSPVSPGLHTLRVDQLGPDGRVLSRVELPFQRTAMPADALAGGRAVVQPGQNLWRIARQSYGQGTRYTVIYLANRDQIRDPNRIYPGQIFAVPPRS